jgi:bifunctional DNA-binding transcriptional regulator/antitoxin component of YhaV-PrlF toxin-antitoxin module
MATETDDRGRLYLPKELRERHGERFRVVDLPSRIVLVPVDDDPLEAVREAVGDVFEGKTATELKREARDAAREEVENEIREREERRKADRGGEEES